jgi:hypothetical protein
MKEQRNKSMKSRTYREQMEEQIENKGTNERGLTSERKKCYAACSIAPKPLREISVAFIFNLLRIFLAHAHTGTGGVKNSLTSSGKTVNLYTG